MTVLCVVLRFPLSVLFFSSSFSFFPTMPAAAAAASVARTKYSSLLSAARWTAVVAGVIYAGAHQGTLQKIVDKEAAGKKRQQEEEGLKWRRRKQGIGEEQWREKEKGRAVWTSSSRISCLFFLLVSCLPFFFPLFSSVSSLSLCFA